MILQNEQLYDKTLQLIGEEADALGLECYVIGGWVRDMFLHRESKDIDIVVVGSGITLAESIKNRLGRHAHLSVFKTYGTAQVKYHDIELEFVGARKESYRKESRNPIVEDGTLEEDQNRRDFTINAMAICLNSNRYGELLDPFNGQDDLQEGTIRTPLAPDITFSDDPLRMMRAIRFATQLGFFLCEETFDAIAKNKERIRIITAERIADEMQKIMVSRKPSVGWWLLEKTGLLEILCPELHALRGIDTIEGKAHKDIFSHTLQVLDNVSANSDNIWLRWAALLHDIGKPRTKHFDSKIGWTFYNHNYVGQKMLPKIFARLKLPLNDKLRYVQKLVDLHMRPINLIEDTVTDSAIRRLLFEAGEEIDDLMLLCDADITSRNQDKVKRFHNNYQLVRQKMRDIEQKDQIRNFQPPIDGLQIMEELHLEPCAAVGEIKKAIKEAILDGIIPNEYEAAHGYMLELAKQRNLY